MEELIELLFYLLGRLFQLIVWLVKRVHRLVVGAARFLARQQRGDGPRVSGAPQPQQTAAAPSSPAQPPPSSAPWGTETGLGAGQLIARLDRVARQAAVEAERCAAEEPNQRFCATLEDYVVPRACEASARLGREGGRAFAAVAGIAEHLEFLTRMIGAMAAQRRDDDLLLLLGDSDALGEACYRPILEYARGQDLRLLHDHVVTLLGDEDLAALTGPIPNGLAPIVLPLEWATEVAWWPALAHEVGHCFYRSAPGLDGELRRALQLPSADEQLSPHALTARDLEVAFGCWLEEIFADAFGVMMLGPALVKSGMWLLGSPQQPQQVSICQLGRGPRSLDEHPPPHLRVLLSCWLLGEMGYPAEADHHEAAWRRTHGSPAVFYFPLPGGSWGVMDEEVLFSRGVPIVQHLYEGQLAALGDESLRSIPGLDFGPHEHQAALEAAETLASGHRSRTSDPRCLIAGAALARFARPDAAAQILQAARSTIPALGVSRRRLRRRLRQEEAAEEARDREGLLDHREIVEAILLDAILQAPPGRHPTRAIRAH